MFLPLPLLLLPLASARSYTSQSEHITTTAWMYSPSPPSTNLGYFARVLNVTNSHTTLAIKPDLNPDIYALNTSSLNALGYAAYELTVTVAPTYYGQGISVRRDALSANTDVRNVIEAARMDCAKTSGASKYDEALCTLSEGAILASVAYCGATYMPLDGEPRETRSREPAVVTYTYPARGSEPAGTETLTRPGATAAASATVTATPEWCGGDGTKGREALTTFRAPEDMFVRAHVTITRGMEVLFPSSSSTGMASEATGTQNAGARVPVRTAGPVVVGIAVAAALVA